MILVGLGANLPTARHGPPVMGLEAALAALPERGIRVVARSRWYRSAPVPRADQPWYVNGVAALETALPPRVLLARLLELEAAFGRAPRAPLEARVLDLDLLDYRGEVARWPADEGGPALSVPHPRLAGRAFVLRPLRDVAPDWRHPASGQSVDALLRQVPADQAVELLKPG